MADPLSITTWRNMFTKHGSKFGWGLAIIFGAPLVIGFGWSQYANQNSGQGAALAAQNAEAARVNGAVITQGDFQRAFLQAGRAQPTQPGPQFAQLQGGILDQLSRFLILQQEAKRRGVRASDAEVDKAITQMREQVLGPKASDADWERYVLEAQGMSPSEFRDYLADQMVGQALLTSLAAEEKVTEDEAKKQNAEVKLSYVLIPTINPDQPPMMQQKGPKPMPEADAKKMAEALLTKAKGGADMAALAKTHSADFTAQKGGDLGWQKEFISSAFPMQGKEFAEAVRKTEKGKFTEVVQVKGFQPGFAFAKVTGRRNDLPKEFDAKKAVETLKQERAQEKLTALFKDLYKQAKIEVKDPDKKAYYDYFQLRSKEQQQMMAQFGQGGDDVPTKEEIEKLKAEVDRELEEMQKRNPKDATVALLLIDALKAKRMDPKTPAADREKTNDRLMELMKVALEGTENRDLRFELADMYRQKKQNTEAEAQYAMIARLQNARPPYNLQTATEANQVHRRLVAAFNSVSKPEEAEKQQKLVANTDKMMSEEKKKEDIKRKELEKQQKAEAVTPSGGVQVAPGGTVTVDTPVATGDAKKAEQEKAAAKKEDAPKSGEPAKPDAAKPDSSKP